MHFNLFLGISVCCPTIRRVVGRLRGGGVPPAKLHDASENIFPSMTQTQRDDAVCLMCILISVELSSIPYIIIIGSTFGEQPEPAHARGTAMDGRRGAVPCASGASIHLAWLRPGPASAGQPRGQPKLSLPIA